MGTGQAAIEIARPADDVWAVVRDFGDIAWLPGIDGVTVDGDTRTISMLGMEIVEELRRNDDQARCQVYGIVGGGIQVDHHEGTITVHPDGQGSRVTWDVDVSPDSLTDLMVQTYQGGLQALKAKLEQ